jgi:peptidyl-prolyl cis-trans isomerase B (cyclophilin B)
LPAVLRPSALLLACLCLSIAGCGGDDAKNDKPSSSGAESTPADTITKPTEQLDPAKTYVATVSTSSGDFQITLDAKRAPKTGGSFKYLADKKFFDNLSFHRIVKDFVIQGGDPAGDGSGGPGYTIVEAPPGNLKYKKGVVAMAKTGTDPPGASGSQFFVVTGPGAATLPPEYALLGKVTSGMAVVDKINAVPADPDTGKPTEPVTIKSIRVTES